MRYHTIGWILLALALAATCPSHSSAQYRLKGEHRRVLRLNADLLVGRTFGIDADFGFTDFSSVVVSASLWQFPNWGCARPGPVQREDGTSVPQAPYPPCTPEGWSVSGGLRGEVSPVFGEIDLGLYRYDEDQGLMAPFVGGRIGLAPEIGGVIELQFALHLAVVSSYNSEGFNPAEFLIGAWDMGLGIPLGSKPGG